MNDEVEQNMGDQHKESLLKQFDLNKENSHKQPAPWIDQKR